MPDVGDGGMEAANHIPMCVPMQQSCMIWKCNSEPKVQLKKQKDLQGIKKHLNIHMKIFISKTDTAKKENQISDIKNTLEKSSKNVEEKDNRMKVMTTRVLWNPILKLQD